MHCREKIIVTTFYSFSRKENRQIYQQKPKDIELRNQTQDTTEWVRSKVLVPSTLLLTHSLPSEKETAKKCRYQEFNFPLWYAADLGTKSEHQGLNDSHIFVSFTPLFFLLGTKFQYSCKRRQDEEGKQSDKAAIRDMVLTFCPTMHCVQQRKLKLLMPAFHQ